MNTTHPRRSHSGTGAPEPRLAAAAAAALTAIAVAAGPLLPGAADYTDAFVPPGLPVLAAALGTGGMLASLAGRRWGEASRTALLAVIGVAAVALLWTSGGLVFDLLRIASLVTGADVMPAEVDWPGVPVRLTALAAALLVAVAGLRFARATANACARCGRVPGAPPRTPARGPAVVAVVAALPYPVLKTLWMLGVNVGLASDDTFAHDALAWLPVLPVLVGLALSLALAHPRGFGAPRWLLLAGGWFSAVVLGTVGLPAAYVAGRTLLDDGLLTAIGGISSWVYVTFYLSWLLWAAALTCATWDYQQRTRGHCPACPG
ncbi:hypothetical protein [Actinorugispora endophytica]|uniref:Uncharacterized protein n=1 Tax=Actinorugispora endophytica TaxID=1605990 RepID=A0A4V3D9A7_9ACTN|nr:hypothetical protein [Actinorugispora endophytica]TDQ55440.1 hypothetical protein EV190_101767 [Actinorugispora endophytica]